jgi:hypothetical protein
MFIRKSTVIRAHSIACSSCQPDRSVMAWVMRHGRRIIESSLMSRRAFSHRGAKGCASHHDRSWKLREPRRRRMRSRVSNDGGRVTRKLPRI